MSCHGIPENRKVYLRSKCYDIEAITRWMILNGKNTFPNTEDQFTESEVDALVDKIDLYYTKENYMLLVLESIFTKYRIAFPNKIKHYSVNYNKLTNLYFIRLSGMDYFFSPSYHTLIHYYKFNEQSKKIHNDDAEILVSIFEKLDKHGDETTAGFRAGKSYSKW